MLRFRVEDERNGMKTPLWSPSPDRTRTVALTEFREAVEADWNRELPDTAALHRFAIENPERFWPSLADYAGISAETWGDEVLVDADAMPGARWFPDARLNYAENLLLRRDDADAIVFWGEERVRRRLSFRALYDEVSRLRQALIATGVEPGDRVAGYLPNMPETVIAMLAATSLGAVWSSCSPDFGVDGVLERFGQIEPTVLFAADGYFFKNRTLDALEKAEAIAEHLPSVKRTVMVPYVSTAPDLGTIPNALTWEAFVQPYEAGDITFPRFPFNHPLFVMFSSGTTGRPKCIVHGAGGTLLEHAKEHRLHCDIRPDDKVFYFTTCGWMMWNWLVSALAAQATLLLYDGNPFHPGPEALFDLADAEGMTLFGTSAKYLDALRKAGAEPRRSHRLDSLRTMTSTGSPLAPETFDWVYGAIKEDLHLASISGGTDILGCFVLGDPTAPVYRGEIQTASLGLAVEVFDQDASPLASGKGELVCTRPFPSMPIAFGNDPDGSRYRGAYFERFPGVWHHGDFMERSEHGGFVIHGRSDATLNPGGVRIGTAEIYRRVEPLDEVTESLAVGQEWEGDVRVVLFVVLVEGGALTPELEDRIRRELREHCSPRHVPARILVVPALPRTRSGKITELAVRDVIHGRDVENLEALANPEALDHFRNRAELAG